LNKSSLPHESMRNFGRNSRGKVQQTGVAQAA
jgi:hypothetical protein